MANLNQENNPKNLKAFAVEYKGAIVSCDGDLSRASIDSGSNAEITEPGEFSLSHLDFLKLAFKVLSSSQIEEAFPHAALPNDISDVYDKLGDKKSDSQVKKILKFKSVYQAEFGMQDFRGKTGGLGYLINSGEVFNWGTGLELSYDGNSDGDGKFKLSKSIDFVSLHAVVDVLVAFVSDFQTTMKFPNFSVPYLRRWGEDSFENGQLLKEIPENLNSDIHLSSDSEDEDDFWAEADFVSDSAPDRNIGKVGDNEQDVTLSEEQLKVIHDTKFADLSEKEAELEQSYEELDQEWIKIGKLRENMEAKEKALQARENALTRASDRLRERESRLEGVDEDKYIQLENLANKLSAKGLSFDECMNILASLAEKEKHLADRERDLDQLENGLINSHNAALKSQSDVEDHKTLSELKLREKSLRDKEAEFQTAKDKFDTQRAGVENELLQEMEKLSQKQEKLAEREKFLNDKQKMQEGVLLEIENRIGSRIAESWSKRG